MTVTGEVLAGRYRIGAVLGRGGMAEVRRAEDLGTGEPVAVKLLRGVDTEAVRRLGAERQTMGRLAHPGLVGLRDAGLHRGEPFLVLDLVDGVDLAGLLQRGPLSPARAAGLLGPVAGGLAHAHATGVVHRDVKPSNILVQDDGVGRLGDFGIARLADATRLTATGLVVGTAVYLAPEQLRGAPAGAPADVYALGLVLYECLTGERAFPGTSVESAMARLVRRPHLPATAPTWCRALVDAMTAPDASARPAAADVAAELGRHADDATAPATTERMVPRTAIAGAAVPTDDAAAMPTDDAAAMPTDDVAAMPTDAGAAMPTDAGAAAAATAVVPQVRDSADRAAVPPARSALSSRAVLLLLVGVSLLIAVVGVAVGRQRADRGQPDVPTTAPATSATTAVSAPSSPAFGTSPTTIAGPSSGAQQDAPTVGTEPPAGRGKKKGHGSKGDR